MEKIQKKKSEALSEVKNASDLKQLKELENKYLGKEGVISNLFDKVSEAAKSERAEMGKAVNEFQDEFKQHLKQQKEKLEANKSKRKEEGFDYTLPGKKPNLGHIHPITQERNNLCTIFRGMGFSVIRGPDIESEWYNFDALNFPQDHPAREMQDSLYVEQDESDLSNEERLLMRTHTSPVQIRYMQNNQPPLRIVVPGRVYRNETTDASHEINFYQLEGLMVGKDISVANFKSIIEQFVEEFFPGEVKFRLRPSFFPFTEPSFEVDVSCAVCNGKGCSVCEGTGWVEVIGAGMVHSNVLKNGGLNPDNWQGFAFGMGIDRLVMMKHGINDVRHFYSGNLEFLTQF